MTTPVDSDSDPALRDAVLRGRAVDLVREGRALADLRARLFGRRRTSATLSRYRVLERIGSGAHGVVYRGHDPELDRAVAIKLIEVQGTDEQRAREARAEMLHEAQTLASISHPNVLTVYDVGTYRGDEVAPSVDDSGSFELGLPGYGTGVFMVLEFIDGCDLASWLRVRRRTRAEIVERFVQAARGLAAAHRAGLIHRDFKPANVLVDREGTVKVADFGLARRSGEPARVGADVREMSRGVAGTPAYMPPEQHEGRPLDSRADVFAFCASLFEALYGVRPFDGSDLTSLHAAKRERRIRVPPRRRRVDAWLARIVQKGLRPRPEERFATMQEVLVALDWPRRRRRNAALGVVGVCVGLGSAVASKVYDEGRTRAACREDVAQTGELWNEMFRQRIRDAFAAVGLRWAPAAAQRTNGAIDHYVRELQEARTRLCESTSSAGERSMSRLQRASSCLDRAEARTRELISMLMRADAGIAQRGVTAVSDLPSPRGCLETPVEALGNLTGIEPGPELAAGLARAALARRLGDREQAERLAEAVLSQAEKEDDPVGRARIRLLLGVMASDRGEYERAAELVREAIVIAERSAHTVLVTQGMIQLLGIVGYGLGRGDEAEHLQPQIEARLARHAERDEIGELMAQEFAGTFAHNVGITFVGHGRYAEAREAFREALQLRQARYGVESPKAFQEMASLGTVASDLYEEEEALALLEEATGLGERLFGEEHPDLGMVLVNLGRVQLRFEAFDEARETLERAADIATRSVGNDTPLYLAAQSTLADLEFALGDHAAAQRLLEHVLEGKRRRFGEDSAEVGWTHAALAEVAQARGDGTRARRRAEQSVERIGRSRGPDHPSLRWPLSILAGVDLAAGRIEQAKAALERAQALASKVEGVDPVAPELHFLRAQCEPDEDEARALADRALEGFRALRGAPAQRRRAAVETWMQSRGWR